MYASCTVEENRNCPATICELYNELTGRVNLEHLDKICEVLNCDICDILVREPSKKSEKSYKNE